MDSETRLLTVPTKRFNTAGIFSVATTILLTLITTVFCIGFLMRYEVQNEVSNIESISYWKDELAPEQQFWFDEGIEELNIALNKNWNRQRARNVIIYLTTGIGPETLAAARFSISDAQLPKRLMTWDSYPHMGRLKNSCSAADICDPFTVFTALLGGVRTHFRIGGLDASARLHDCAAAANNRSQVKSILQQAQEAGLRTGFVTTKRVTGPTAAALYAHTPHTGWECDGTMPLHAIAAGCEDIATQLVRSETGRKVNVVLGGGRQTLISNVPVTKWDPIDDAVCNSQDKRNLIRDWRQQHLRQKHHFAVLHSREELTYLNGSNVDYALGIFANSNLKPMMKPNRTENLTPDLSEMVNKSLHILRRKDAGYLLLVETGVKPKSDVRLQLEALLQLNAVVEQTQKLISDEDTLTLVVFTKGDYVRSSVDVSAESEINPNFVDFSSENEALIAEQLQNMVTDTMVYAKGPRSFLLHGVHEETYMSYVISYALKMGAFDSKRYNKASNTTTP